ncbi:TonB-dependent receptor [Joostella atrarenae]|uniref:TonB-dependent receptor n=1 Tax=Joostella atrarenae TaxID=679257 RepID=A0ABS9J4V5_9FLAO|nr:TonB-dependent receptor [Joostella atrarenae]MCF8715472.1 TonB-dependent receptor [Joostella atrarenae]
MFKVFNRLKERLQKSRKVVSLLGIFILTTCSIYAQTAINGKVTGPDGTPLPGVTIFVKGTTNGTQTDFDGNYSISIQKENVILTFSYIGFSPQEIPVQGKNEINISMKEDVTALEDVVVIGYGKRKREDLIGAVSTVDSKSIQDKQVNTFQEALIGQVSGVQFRQNGAPDGAPQLTIRGVASLGNNTPLYVVDGFPLGNSTAIASQRDNYILSGINPDDIESISILKDASAKAIYGSRASNGVVIITTKQGKKGKPTFTFGTSLGVQSIPDYEKPDVLNAQELYQYQLDFYEDKEADNLPLGGIQIQNRDFLLGLDDIDPDNDWFDLITRDAFVKDYNIAVRGGGENSKYSVSAALQNREGTLINTGFKRYSINANLDIDINKRLRFGINFAPTRSVATGGRTDAGANNFDIFNAVSLSAWTDPTAPLYDDQGMLTGVTDGNLLFRSRNINPVTLLTERVDERVSNQLRMGSFVEYDILENLTAKTFGTLQYIDRYNRQFQPSRFPGDNLNPSLLGTQMATAQVFDQNNFNWVWENTLNFSKTLGKHDIDALVGFTMEKRQATSSLVRSTNLADETIQLPSAANSVEPTDFEGNSQTDSNALISMIARLNYAYDNRYYLTATIRRDGSSRFGEGTRNGNFPSIAAAWRISNEKFFESLKPTISDFKIEGGFGISGNNGLGNYESQGSIAIGQDYIFGGQNAPGVAVDGLPNLLAKWEETEETNFGIDLGLFNNRVYISVDYYNISSVDFLALQPLPTTSGFDNVRANIGEINNEGFEIDFKVEILRDTPVKWSTNFNFSKNKNKVIDLVQEEGFFYPAGSFLAGINITEVREGESIGLFRGLKVTGLFTEEDLNDPDVPKYPDAIVGSLKFEDVPTVDTDGDGIPDEGDGVLNTLDATIIGDSNPDFIFGMSHQIYWNNFDLSLTLDGAFGGDIFYGQNQFLGNQDDGQFNIDRRLLERFRPGDDPTTKEIPGIGSNSSRQFFRNPNSLSIKDGSYLWVRNITFGYTFDESLIKYFKNARVYASIQNPFLFTKYEFGSPTVNRAADNALVRNVDYGSYPISQVLTLGFNVTF